MLGTAKWPCPVGAKPRPACRNGEVGANADWGDAGRQDGADGVDPRTFQPVAFILYLAAATAEAKRIPFDLPEGESEIVAGYFIEHGSFKFGMFFFSEYIEVVILSGVLVTLFLGGWHLPFLHRSGFIVDISWLGIHWIHSMQHWIVALIQVLTFGVKLAATAWFSLMIRWTLPRFRYDQLMDLCWRYIVPLAAVNIIITAIIVLVMR